MYYICGELIGEDRYTMRLVKDNELEGMYFYPLSLDFELTCKYLDTKKLFKNITGMHVYSVLPYEPKVSGG